MVEVAFNTVLLVVLLLALFSHDTAELIDRVVEFSE